MYNVACPASATVGDVAVQAAAHGLNDPAFEYEYALPLATPVAAIAGVRKAISRRAIPVSPLHVMTGKELEDMTGKELEDALIRIEARGLRDESSEWRAVEAALTTRARELGRLHKQLKANAALYFDKELGRAVGGLATQQFRGLLDLEMEQATFHNLVDAKERLATAAIQAQESVCAAQRGKRGRAMEPTEDDDAKSRKAVRLGVGYGTPDPAARADRPGQSQIDEWLDVDAAADPAKAAQEADYRAAVLRSQQEARAVRDALAAARSAETDEATQLRSRQEPRAVQLAADLEEARRAAEAAEAAEAAQYHAAVERSKQEARELREQKAKLAAAAEIARERYREEARKLRQDLDAEKVREAAMAAAAKAAEEEQYKIAQKRSREEAQQLREQKARQAAAAARAEEVAAAAKAAEVEQYKIAQTRSQEEAQKLRAHKAMEAAETTWAEQYRKAAAAKAAAALDATKTRRAAEAAQEADYRAAVDRSRQEKLRMGAGVGAGAGARPGSKTNATAPSGGASASAGTQGQDRGSKPALAKVLALAARIQEQQKREQAQTADGDCVDPDSTLSFENLTFWVREDLAQHTFRAMQETLQARGGEETPEERADPAMPKGMFEELRRVWMILKRRNQSATQDLEQCAANLKVLFPKDYSAITPADVVDQLQNKEYRDDLNQKLRNLRLRDNVAVSQALTVVKNFLHLKADMENFKRFRTALVKQQAIRS
jgi:hypothetical protein